MSKKPKCRFPTGVQSTWRAEATPFEFECYPPCCTYPQLGTISLVETSETNEESYPSSLVVLPRIHWSYFSLASAVAVGVQLKVPRPDSAARAAPSPEGYRSGHAALPGGRYRQLGL